jgi:acetyl-CoA C-acetyltransferase
MGKRVGICAVAQTIYQRSNTAERFQGMALEVIESLLKQTNLEPEFSAGGIDTAITVSDDVYDARTISDNAMTDVLGAHYGCEEKVAQDGAQAIYYGVATILSGHTDLVLVVGHCKESQGQSRNMVTHLAFDPFYTRPVGLDFCSAAALQAQAYMARSGVTERHLAKIVARARRQATKNPCTPEVPAVTEEAVLRSPLVADPLRELHCHPVSDGAVGLILASEERTRAICRTPVWVTGVGNCFDSFFLGDRDLATSSALHRAAARAYGRAGIEDARHAFDVVEVSDPFAHQLPMWIEGLGLCATGKGGRWLDDAGPDALQLMDRAGERQVDGARRALAHGVMGPAGQFHSVVILERER